MSHELTETDLKAGNNYLVDLLCFRINVSEVLSKVLKIFFANMLTSL